LSGRGNGIGLKPGSHADVIVTHKRGKREKKKKTPEGEYLVPSPSDLARDLLKAELVDQKKGNMPAWVESGGLWGGPGWNWSLIKTTRRRRKVIGNTRT